MRVAVVGAGIIGLACAEELLRAGHDVRVFDPAPATGATQAAAGMIAPAGEAWYGELPLLRLGLASARLWPEYADRLGRRSGTDVDFRAHGTLLVGRDQDDLQQVRRTLDVLPAEGVAFTELDRRELRDLEPVLARSAGGALLPDDHCVNPRKVAEALLRLVGDRLVRLAVQGVDDTVRLADGSRFECDAVVLAAGADARTWVPWVRPVKGETIRVRAADPPSRVLRARVHGEQVYVVPRAGGEVVIGATEEEHATTPHASVGAVVRLLSAARSLLPGLETADVLDITARHRPGTPDNGPILGPRPAEDAGSSLPQVLAVGHYRGGVLLAPLTARVVRAHLEGEPVPPVALSFTADRFRAAPSGSPRTPSIHGRTTP